MTEEMTRELERLQWLTGLVKLSAADDEAVLLGVLRSVNARLENVLQTIEADSVTA